MDDRAAVHEAFDRLQVQLLEARDRARQRNDPIAYDEFSDAYALLQALAAALDAETGRRRGTTEEDA